VALRARTDPTSWATTRRRVPEAEPDGRIPTLVDGSFVLFESMAINLYIAKKYGAAVLQPKSLEDEARAVQWSFWVMTECEPHLIQIMLHKVMMPEAMRKPEVVKTSAEALDKPLRVLDAALAGRETLLGGASTSRISTSRRCSGSRTWDSSTCRRGRT